MADFQSDNSILTVYYRDGSVLLKLWKAKTKCSNRRRAPKRRTFK